MAALTPQELENTLRSLANWRLAENKLVRDYAFPDFAQALAFVNQVGILAESQDHHPDIDIRYNKVRLALISHDAGGITRRDAKLAALLDVQFA